MFRRKIGLFGALAIVTFTGSSFAAAQYTVKDIGTLGTHCYAERINALGQVVGGSVTETGNYRAFLYSDGVMTNLGTLGGPSFGVAINDLGHVAGSYIALNGKAHAFLYANGIMTDLHPAGLDFSGARAINNAGLLAGEAGGSGYNYVAVLFDNGQVISIGKLGSEGVAVTDMNNSGHVVGYSDAPRGRHAFLYANGAMRDLTPSAAFFTGAYGINDLEQIVGVHNGSAFLYEEGQMTLVDARSLVDINIHSQAVGQKGDMDHLRAILWQDGVVQDLNDLIDPGLGWTLYLATGINDRGQIVARGVNATGTTHSFILTPVPEPSLAFMLVAMPWLIGRRRSRRCSR